MFSMSTCGELTCVPKTRHPAGFFDFTGGVFAFQAASTQCSFSKSPLGQTAPSTSMIKASAQPPQPPFGESSEKIDLNKLLITNEIATVFCRISGRSMEPHMRNGGVLMVDKSIEPKVGKVVIAAINGEMTVKRLSVVDSQMTLTADNLNYLDVKVSDFDESMIWGVVTNIIHQL